MEELRIVLVGRTGAGKSETGNTILQRKAFPAEMSPSSVTEECKRETGEFDGQKVVVADTPGLFDTSKTQEEIIKEITRCILFSAPGPHVFLVVIQLGRFTKEEQETVKLIQMVFGEDAARYTMVLFTRGDDLKGVEIKTYVDKSADLCKFIHQCHEKYHVFNNTDKDPSQVRELLEKINMMVERNGGSYYTNEMFQKVQRVIREEAERTLRENPQMTQEDATELALITLSSSIGTGAAIGAGIGAGIGTVFGPVGAAIGVGIGAIVGGITAITKNKCVIQ